MRKLKLFFACLLMAVLSIGQMWGADPSVKSTFSTSSTVTDNKVTENGVTWTLDVTVAAGTPTITTGTASSTQGLKFGSSGSNYYSPIKFSTDYFKDYNVKSVTIYEKNNGSKIGTLTVKQGSITIGTASHSAKTSDWATLTASGTKGEGGTLEVTYEVAQASYFNYIEVVYEEGGTTCTSEITITKADDPANGTFALDNSGTVCIDEGNATVNVTATPNTGYHLATVVSAEGTIGDIEGNTCQITNIGASTTISVTFAENPKYKVSFNVGGSTASQADITEASAGAGITLPDGPTPTCSGDGWTFAGWKETSAVDVETTTAPTLLAAGANYKPATDCTLFAVYKKDGGSGGSATVTITPSEITGDADPYTLTHDQAAYTIQINKNGGTKPAINATAHDARVYANSTMVISNASPMTELVFNISTQGKKRLAPITASVGSIAAQASGDETVTWTGNATEVTFTVGATADYGSDGSSKAGQLDFDNISATAGSSTIYYFSAPTCAAPTCEDLGTPSVTVTNKTYNSAKLTWAAVDNADKYLVKFNGVDQEATENLYFDATGLEAEETYTYQVKALAEEGQDDYCDGEFTTEANFTTEAAPTAHLTLIDIEGTHASSGDYAIGTPFNLPTTAASCSKTFVGWDPDDECATEPTYAKGAEFTFANTTSVTLYAVYADETPGAATLTKLNGSSMPVAGDKIVIVGIDTNDDSKHALYQETSGSSYVKHWTFDNDVATVAADAKKYVTLEAATDGKFYLGDATNGYVYSSGSNNLSVDLTNKTAWTIAWDADASAFTFNQGRYLSCRSDLTGDNTYLYRLAGGTPAGIWKLDVYKYGTSASTFSNYSTTCIAAPEAIVDPEEVNAPAAGVANGVIVAAYENVNEAEVAVALYSNAACTEAFEGSWLTASINGDKNIAYTIAENTSYNDIRTAYIKLTAPETNGAASPAVVVIPVEQARKPAVFASLAELVAASVNSGMEVTVSFTNEVITDDHYISQGTKRAGVLLTTKAANDKAIEIFYNKGETVVPAAWVIGGSLSATSKTFTWTFFNDQWELVPLGTEWTWNNGDLTYTAPKTVSSVVVTGAPTKTTYVDGEKFAPAGLTVTVNYNDDSHEENPVGVTFECTPARVAKSENPVSVSVVATFNEVSSEAFPVNVTVGDIQLKTTQEFIAAGNADMRCYLEGIVSDIETGTKLKYGNFNLTDASGTIYVYGCLNQDGEAQKFDELGVQNGDKIKVIAEDYDYYNSKHEAKNVQFVSKTPAATISIDDIDMETGDELALSSIVATITPAAAESATITYEVTEGTAVSISEGKIIANAEGVATITASIAEGVGYLAANTTFTVTVTAPDTRKKAILNAPYTVLNGDLSSTDIKYTTAQGGGTAVPAITAADKGSYIRLYKIASGNNYGGYITFNGVKGCKIDQVQITVGANASLAYCKDAEAIPTSGAESVSKDAVFSTSTGLDAESVTVVNLSTSNAFDVAAIKVYYNGDPLAVHHYFLGGTYATEFEQYGTFSYEGLTVTAAYDEQETITEPVSGFTVEADLMTAGAKKAYVYLNDVEIAQYDITVNAATKENPALAYTPNVQEIAAEDVASWSAPAFSNTFNVSPITYTSNKTSVATVDENGVIALAGGYGTAIITATFAEDDDYIASVATYTITVNEPVEDLSGTWVVAKSVAAGDRIIIGATYQGNTKTMGLQNTSNRAAVASTLDAGVLTPAEGTKTFTLVNAGDGKFALQALNGKYLSSTAGSSNELVEVADYTDGKAKWTIEIDGEGVASVVASAGTKTDLRYNNSSNIFSCYGGTQNAINIYKIGTPDYGSYQRSGLTIGNYGTICLPKAGVISGATLFEIADYANDMIYVDEITSGEMVAGRPYIFQATANQLNVTYTSATVEETAGDANGLYGFYDLDNENAQFDIPGNAGNYILYSNQYWLVDNVRAAYINNFRAYIKLSQINNTGNQAPGIRRVAMQVNGQNTTTGVDNLNAGETPVKVMINGQMYILRGEKMYNANGQLVK